MELTIEELHEELSENIREAFELHRVLDDDEYIGDKADIIERIWTLEARRVVIDTLLDGK